jgi:hypothetical protein
MGSKLHEDWIIQLSHSSGINAGQRSYHMHCTVRSSPALGYSGLFAKHVLLRSDVHALAPAAGGWTALKH